MWIAIGIVAIAVLVMAAYAGLGRFGDMPADPVTDRPRGIIPDGLVNDEFLAAVRIPKATTGYHRGQVDQYLAEIAAGTAIPAEDQLFDVVRSGYDMQVVDHIIERPRYERPAAADEVISTGSTAVAEPQSAVVNAQSAGHSDS